MNKTTTKEKEKYIKDKYTEKRDNRFRKIKKWGNSFVIVLNPIDIEDLNIQEGDMFDISDGFILSKAVYDLTKSNGGKNDK